MSPITSAWQTRVKSAKNSVPKVQPMDAVSNFCCCGYFKIFLFHCRSSKRTLTIASMPAVHDFNHVCFVSTSSLQLSLMYSNDSTKIKGPISFDDNRYRWSVHFGAVKELDSKELRIILESSALFYCNWVYIDCIYTAMWLISWEAFEGSRVFAIGRMPRVFTRHNLYRKSKWVRNKRINVVSCRRCSLGGNRLPRALESDVWDCAHADIYNVVQVHVVKFTFCYMGICCTSVYTRNLKWTKIVLK